MTRAESKAYWQGKRDFKAGRSIFSPRYADKERDNAWCKGMADASIRANGFKWAAELRKVKP